MGGGGGGMLKKRVFSQADLYLYRREYVFSQTLKPNNPVKTIVTDRISTKSAFLKTFNHLRIVDSRALNNSRASIS